MQQRSRFGGGGESRLLCEGPVHASNEKSRVLPDLSLSRRLSEDPVVRRRTTNEGSHTGESLRSGGGRNSLKAKRGAVEGR